VLDEHGRFVLGESYTLDGILADFRASVLPKPEDESGMAFFPTPPEAAWEHVAIRFRDNHSVSVVVGSASGIYHYSQMGMADGRDAKPTKQWELLRDFAEEHGILDWGSRKANRKKQKHRESLAEDLRRFFRIEGDPIASEGNGWRTLFAVVLST